MPNPSSADTDIGVTDDLGGFLHLQLIPHAIQRKVGKLAILEPSESELPSALHQQSGMLLEKDGLGWPSLDPRYGQASSTIPVPSLDAAIFRVRRHLIWTVAALVGVAVIMVWL